MNFGTFRSPCWPSIIASFNSIPSRAITQRTKMIIVNTPHNPVGKVFTKKELESIAALAQEFNLLVMSDEVVGVMLQ
jgi:aspartate/methionine/tyrosine aminotransferase